LRHAERALVEDVAVIGAFGFEPERVAFERDLHAIGRDAGDVGDDEDLVGVFVDVDGRRDGAPLERALAPRAVRDDVGARVAHDPLAFTVMGRGSASLALGSVTVRTPFCSVAVTASASTRAGSGIARSNFADARSR